MRQPTHWLSLVAPSILVCSMATAAQLSFKQSGGKVTISYDGSTGIPSWKVVIDRDNGANLDEVHVPANGPNLCYIGGNGPTLVPIVGPGSTGWDYFRGFTPSIFKIEEQSSTRVVISMGGTAPRKKFEHYRTYTFTKEGIKIKGRWVPLVWCRHVSNWGGWDYRHLETPGEKLPMRSQGTTEWKYMNSGASDGSPKSLPAGVSYPLETQIKIRGHESLYMIHRFDQKLESMRSRLLYQVLYNKTKMNDIMGSWRGVAPQEVQNYQIRVHFVDEGSGSTPPPNQAPLGKITASVLTGQVGDSLAFDGSGSSDTDGTIKRYDWDFGDGITATGPQTSHVWSTAGTYDVALSVTDDLGLTGKAVTRVTIGAAPDVTAPVVALTRLKLEGMVDDAAVASIAVAGSTVLLSAGKFSTDLPIAASATTISLKVVDTLGNSSTRTLSVQP